MTAGRSLPPSRRKKRLTIRHAAERADTLSRAIEAHVEARLARYRDQADFSGYFCPGTSSRTWSAIASSGTFCVNVLAVGQQEVARRFGVSGADKFAGPPEVVDTLLAWPRHADWL